MTSTELRVGNLAYYDGSVKSITAIDILNIEESEARSAGNFFIPIPLTEEWLVKFGWELEPLNTYFKRYIRKSGGMRIEVYDDNKFWTEYIYIKHVHTLQNLYFALTGEELVCK